MELALYCPGLGYYERPRAIGRHGDYFTSVSVGPLFGELLAAQFEAWLRPPAGEPCQIVEGGAHDGRLAADILNASSRNQSALWPTLEYWIVEPSATRQAWQRQTLEKFAGRVRWFDSFSALPDAGVYGVIFANELLDAMPIRRLAWDAAAGRWSEWCVSAAGPEFVWQRRPLAEDAAALLRGAGLEQPEAFQAVLPGGFVIELAPAAAVWWREAAQALRSGWLLTLDYGWTIEEWFAPERGRGTLRAYRDHRPSAHPLAHPGEQDLTAHVNFTQLQVAGEAAGLRTEPLVWQEQFLTRLAQRASSEGPSGRGWDAARVRQFQTLTHPAHLGRRFRVFVQRR
jgi:SAM-dependent MidA family methyltransferase